MIDFDGKTYANILKEQLERIPDSIDKRDGSIIQTALGPESWYLEGMYMDLAKLQNNVYADTAVGDALDKIAKGYGIDGRKQATSAVRKAESNIKVPIGFRASAVISGVYIAYKVIEYQGESENVYFYAVQCESPGEIGNVYSGDLIPIDHIPGLISVRLTSILIPGSEEEKDASLKARILSKFRNPSTSGNKYDYYNWSMECDGVGAAKVFPLANGPGTVKVVIANSSMASASATLINQVKTHIEELRPIGADVTVTSVVEKAVNISAGIRLKSGMNLGTVQNAFLASVTEFLYENAFTLSYVSAARIGKLLLETDGVEDYTDLQLNGEVTNVVLTTEEIAVIGAVTLSLEV